MCVCVCVFQFFPCLLVVVVVRHDISPTRQTNFQLENT